jgi:hypothetical protein
MTSISKTLMAAAAVVAIAGPASATVVTFDDLTGQAPVVDGYGGINWGGQWTYYGYAQDPYTPHSGNYRVYDAATDAGFTFAAPVVFNGAWFAGKDTSSVQFQLLLGGSVVATSASLGTSVTPAFLSSGYAGLVDQVKVLSGQPDFWVMDDVTYNAGTVGGVPEPASWALMILGFGAVGLTLRGRKMVPAQA